MRVDDRLPPVDLEWHAARLYLLFTPARCVQDPWLTLAQALDGGVQMVQWRVREADPDGLSRCLRACEERMVPVVVNDDVQLSVEHGAAGAHVGQEDLPATEARRLLGPERLLGVSTHDLGQATAATTAGADYLGFGPCFPTITKGYDHGQPAGALAAVVRASPVPVFAIGGIDAGNLPQVLAAGCRRVAVSRAILRAPDPGAAARRLRQLLD